MALDLDYTTFCTQYYEAAMEIAEQTIAGHVSKFGKLNAAIDVDLVKDLGVSYGLERVFNTYDVDHQSKAKIKTYLNVVVHNCVLTELGKESTAAGAKKRKQGVDFFQDPGTYGRQGASAGFRDYVEYSGRFKRKEDLIARLMECVKKLNGVDQVIIDCWMHYRKVDYTSEAIAQLGLEDNARTRNMVSVRCNRAFEKIQKMMKGVRADYRDIYVTFHPKETEGLSEKSVGQLEAPDYNAVRRRKRAAVRTITSGIDYDRMSRSIESDLAD